MITESNVTPRNDLATSSLVIGILSFTSLAVVLLMTVTGHSDWVGRLSRFALPFAAIEVISGIAAVITGAISPKQNGARNEPSVAGMALGLLVIGAILLVPVLFVMAMFGMFGGHGI